MPGAGAAGGYDENIGKSRAGNTSKVHLAVNAYGLPEVFTMIGGHINDCTEAPILIEKIDAAQVLIADKGYDSQIIRDKGRRSPRNERYYSQKEKFDQGQQGTRLAVV